MKYENIKKLLMMTSVSSGLSSFDFNHFIVDGMAIYDDKVTSPLNSLLNPDNVMIVSLQKGVFRTNCIDCLDRTNVVQSVFARYILHQMLFKIKLSDMPSGDPFESFKPVFEANFKILWAEHGDSLSLAYTGTGALKADFVRTGKRTKTGALVDGYLSSKRFYINNFVDGYNQDCHDYFLGTLNPKTSVFKEHSTKYVKIVTPASIILAYVFYSLLSGIAFPKEYEDNSQKKLLRMLIFIGVILFTVRTVFHTLKKTLINLPTKL
jgi:hypothetical protein